MEGCIHTLFQIRAGKCLVEGDLVQPDLRKGTLALVRTEDQLLRVQWSLRDSLEPEEAFYVFEDAYLVRIDECTDGHVYALRFTENDQELLYWMQETSIGIIKGFVDMVNHTIGYRQDNRECTMMDLE
ncbi:Proteasome complex subunit Rpn13 ubiquitin receptor family protein [Babesia bovis T2Bo]|uniref:Pru domain-containing protein n=1 Tax=Babesia bovis TaxID=5865 RepID=A7ANP6_BABBO|nr:Proteasome complex subunit Rpn13 ubiquitin receptor family protein [Babesia bovis T2Bo]EDO08180.1 Proteasome complex subunit Rpn13 ubiquitin receptor family protein [Babesia bovis T2Bo]|eukprot:XP_001611748.1 hypothetical protein [Babesia bovis T2Bo]